MSDIKVALAGVGAFGIKHLEAIRKIDGVKVVSLVSRDLDKTKEVADRFAIAHVTTNLDESLARSDVDAVILCTPTPMHAAQAIACLEAGKHVQVEIPLADSLKDAEAIVALQKKAKRVAMCGHTRRFNPSHQWIHRGVRTGDLRIQQMDVQTYFFRRTNMNALGQPRSWTDHLLWHHAAHTVDLFAYQTGADIVAANALQGPTHPALGIAMDMSIQLKSRTGAICNAIDVSKVDVSMNGIELQDREFFAAIREGREPNASVAQVLPCYRTLARLEAQLAANA